MKRNYPPEMFWVLSAIDWHRACGKKPKEEHEIVWCSALDGHVFLTNSSWFMDTRYERCWPIRNWSANFLLELLEANHRGTGPGSLSHQARRYWNKHDLDWFLPVLREFAKGNTVSHDEANRAYHERHRLFELPCYTGLVLSWQLSWFPKWPNDVEVIVSGRSLPWIKPDEKPPLRLPLPPEYFDPQDGWIIGSRSAPQKDADSDRRDYELLWCSIRHRSIFVCGRSSYEFDRWPGNSATFSEFHEALNTQEDQMRWQPSWVHRSWRNFDLEWFRPILMKLANEQEVTYDEIDQTHRAARNGKALRLYPVHAPHELREEWETEMNYDD